MEAWDRRPHIVLEGFSRVEPYRPPGTPRSVPAIRQRNRRDHGRQLLRQLRDLEPRAAALLQEQRELSDEIPNGLYVTFESEPGFELKVESLDRRPSGIELLSVKKDGHRMLATVFVPEGKLPILEALVRQYLASESKSGRPLNEKLLNNINRIRVATVRTLWTDEPDLLPTEDQQVWWEVWLRAGKDREAIANTFTAHAGALGLEVGSRSLIFPDRTVMTARGTRAQLQQSIVLLNCIAELRTVKGTADFFHGLPPSEQWAWSNDLLQRIEWPAGDAGCVCVLDTGVNLHPLLAGAIGHADCHTINNAWGTGDVFGHGTQMSGLVLYGDLTDVLVSDMPVRLDCRLESVKLLNQNGGNEGELYGALTRDAISLAELHAPARPRTFCMAVTSVEDRDRGKPSTWSAALDSISSGYEDEERRLVIAAGGNTDEESHAEYPDSNTTDSIHDPGQSWNALTVGAVTFKRTIIPAEGGESSPLAPAGDLSPHSSTSATWEKGRPIKPDVVFEGGNVARWPDGTVGGLRCLDLLSVHHQFAERAFDTFWGTSAATALASRLAARLRAAYPTLWPETIRGLMVHSARWTDQMVQRATAGLPPRRGVENLLRHFGHGIPSEKRALWSAGDALTLLVQDQIQPYEEVLDEHGRHERLRAKELRLHPVPWPIAELSELGATPVRMTVTLSYFIEPNPSQRGAWTRRYRYESHGLRFAVKRPLETEDQFRYRINDYARKEEQGTPVGGEDDGWVIGRNTRHLGSLHSDTWEGTAGDLADRGMLAVYPTLGWWREQRHHARWSKPARYALIVSIESSAADVDLYAAVAAQIVAQVVVPT